MPFSTTKLQKPGDSELFMEEQGENEPYMNLQAEDLDFFS